MVIKQRKEEYMYHKRYIYCIETDPDYQKFIIYKLNQIVHQPGELSPKYSSKETMGELMDRMCVSTKLYQLSMRIEVN